MPTTGLPSTPPTEWFRFGDGYLGVESDDLSFRDRFLDQFDECRVAACPPGAAMVRCRVRHEVGGVSVHFDDPEPLDQAPFALRALAELSYAEDPAPPAQWRVLLSPEGARMAFAPSRVMADRSAAWPTVVASLAVHRVLRLQRSSFFFHASSASVDGRGLLMAGPSEAGKTTLSMALADHGHGFYGDEIAAVRHETAELLPFRRRLSIRTGPASAGVARALEDAPFPVAHLGDGTSRTQVNPRAILPPVPVGPVPLSTIFFIRRRASAPHAERFAPNVTHLGLLPPFESVTWSEPRGMVVLRLLRLLGRTRCFFLDLGPIPDTVRLIEDLMRED